ncbi:MAG: accessory factor UbiK family protein [Reyranellaceae bacterium]
MQTRNPLLDDLAKLMSSALGAAGGVREEMEARLRDRLQRVLAGMDLPTREEFEAVKELASRARTAQETLEARVAALETAVAQRIDTPASAEPAIDVASETGYEIFKDE